MPRDESPALHPRAIGAFFALLAFACGVLAANLVALA